MHFTEEHIMMRKMVRDFARKEIAPMVELMESTDEFPERLIKKMGEAGLMGIPVPEAYGGAGADTTSYILAIHEISKVSAAVGVILSVHTSVGTIPILHFGTEAQKQTYIPKLAAGEYIGAFALTEPQSGSDAGGLKTTAVRKGGSYILNGSKIFITNGGAADLYLTFAITDPGKGRKGISAFIVEKNTPGFSIGKKEKKLGLLGSNTVELQFDQAEIPIENRLGEEGEGFSIAMKNLEVGRIGIAAQALGLSKRRSAARWSTPKPAASSADPSLRIRPFHLNYLTWRRMRKLPNYWSIMLLICISKGFRAEKKHLWRSNSRPMRR